MHNMNMLRLATLTVIAACFVTGCGSGAVSTETVPAKPPVKGGQTDSIQNNPNMPPQAKQAILGSQGGK